MSTTTLPQPAMASASTGFPASLPLRRDRSDSDFSTNGMGVGLLLLAVLLIFALYLVLRKSAGKTPRGLGGLLGQLGARSQNSVARQSSQGLTSSASVHVVTWHGEELLLGCTPNSVAVLARYPVEASSSSTSSVGGSGAAP